jgi:hypothetical protein
VRLKYGINGFLICALFIIPHFLSLPPIID